MELELTRSQLVRWRTAVFAIFLASGLSIATWAARVPAIKVALGVDNIQIGLHAPRRRRRLDHRRLRWLR